MFQVKEIEHQWIEMSDGVRLSARLWLPELPGGEEMPAIFEYIPYRKRDMVRLRDQRNHPYFARNGYVSIRVDMRGSGDSEGTMRDMYSPEELDDAIAVIEWIAGQPWCNGRVGMMGTSWGGTASLQAASRRPTALKAIIAVCANNNRFDDDIHHMGGCLLTDSVEWGATLPAILASPPDAETVGPNWREIWRQRLDRLDFPLEYWVRHESRDQYWRRGSVDETPDAIRCPVLMIGGWSDRYSNTVINFLNQSHDRCWGIVGPWGHHYPDQALPGPGIGFQQEAVRWWDHWLKGQQNGIDQAPKLRVWMQGYSIPENSIATRPGHWVSEQQWPSANINNQTFYFSRDSLVLFKSRTDAIAEVPWSLSVGSAAGDTGYFGRTGGLPLDQRLDDEQSLVFQSDRLVKSLDVLGSPTLKVIVGTNRLPATLVVRLSDVHPDGSVARVGYAIQNLALNQDGTKVDSSTDSDTLPVALPVDLDFPNTAYRFATGHRIRIAISSSYWPIIWPSPAPASLSLHLANCALSLPVRNAMEPPGNPGFDPPLGAEELPTDHEVIAAPDLQRWTKADQQTGQHFIHWRQPFHCFYHPGINLRFGFETDACHEIRLDDPNSAVSRFQHRLVFSRDDWEAQVISSAECRSSSTAFHLKGQLRVIENNQVTFERNWDPVVPRTCS